VAAQIHAIVGSDDVEVKRAARDLATQLTPDEGGDFGCDINRWRGAIRRRAARASTSTIEALLTFPFFGGEKLVWLKSANFLADDQLGRSQAVLEALEKLAETLQGGARNRRAFCSGAVGGGQAPRASTRRSRSLAKVTVFD
jgi:DNA polymerase-3 subunit delta